MTKQLKVVACVILCLVSFRGYAEPEALLANVYRDDYISVRAGITALENRIVNFGDVLPMVVEITYNTGDIRLQEMDPAFFSGAWPENMGAYLLNMETTPVPETAGDTVTSRSVYRFQILACPEGAVLCKGSRIYDLPEFTLQYQVLDESGSDASTESVKFRPWPENLMIASAIPLGEEGELNSFPTYFPTGAYPNPLTGLDFRSTATGLIAGGLVFLLGGILMSPFSFFKRKSFAASKKHRWEEVLDTLKSGEIQDEKQFFDALRKSLVWYCVDILNVDPFYWLKHEEEVMTEDHKGTGELAGFRSLFIDLLHNPGGEKDAFLERFTNLVSDAG